MEKGSGVEFLQKTPDMRVPKLTDIEVGMKVYILMDGDDYTVYKDTIRGRLNVTLPGRFFDTRSQQWTDRVVETQKEYEEGYLSWVRFLVKHKRMLVK